MSCSVESCEKPPANSRGWCWGHYYRWRKTGDPQGGGTSPGAPMRFLKDAAAYSGSDCLLWPFGTTAAGYGVVAYGGKATTAHRVVLTLAAGPPESPELQAAHAPGVCHNPRCVNPNHLRWATGAENASDKYLDGTAAIGERSPQAKLTSEQVVAIRADSRSHRLIALDYGVADATVQMIKNGSLWKHLL